MGLLWFERALGFRPGDTFGTVLDRHRGMGPGFDVLRLGLAALIFAGHARWVAGPGRVSLPAGLTGEEAFRAIGHFGEWSGVARLAVALVPMFFALSGFLIMGSAVRNRALSTFMAHRALRLFPALIIEVTLSAVLLGAALTRLPLQDYFTHPDFVHYFTNIAGFVRYTLPGVFETNPVPLTVNQNLWTLPGEMYCYLIIGAFMLTRTLYDRTRMTILMVAATLGLVIAHAVTGMSHGRTPYPTHVIVYYFCLGVLFFHWRDRIPTRPALAIIIVPLAMLFVLFDATTYLAAPFVVWCTVFVGMLPMRKLPLVSSGDYSYGIYLYGFPITQALVAVAPWFVGRPLALTFIAAAITAMFAVASWHLVEKHVLRLKKRLPERWFPTRTAFSPAPQPAA